jgi:hypothetical protein
MAETLNSKDDVDSPPANGPSYKAAVFKGSVSGVESGAGTLSTRLRRKQVRMVVYLDQHATTASTWSAFCPVHEALLLFYLLAMASR